MMNLVTDLWTYLVQGRHLGPFSAWRAYRHARRSNLDAQRRLFDSFLGLALALTLLSPIAASAQTRYSPMPRYYGAPLTPSEAERRALQSETYRLQRDQAEDLRRLRNDLEDRDHQQKMEQFREGFRENR